MYPGGVSLFPIFSIKVGAPTLTLTQLILFSISNTVPAPWSSSLTAGFFHSLARLIKAPSSPPSFLNSTRLRLTVSARASAE